MTGDVFRRVVEALCAGRQFRDVALGILVMFVAATAWAIGGAFLMSMEPMQ